MKHYATAVEFEDIEEIVQEFEKECDAVYDNMLSDLGDFYQEWQIK